MKNKLFSFYFIICSLVSIFLFLKYLNQPFLITTDFIVIITIGCFIEYFFVESEEVKKIAINTITINLIIIFANIQTLLLASTFMVIGTAFAKYRTEESLIKRIFNKKSLFEWTRITISGYLAINLKHLLFIDFFNISNYCLLFIVFFGYIIISSFMKSIYLFLSNQRPRLFKENSEIFSQETLFLLYIVLASIFTSYSYYDRGLFITLIIYVFMIPYQKITSLYFLYVQEQQNANKDDLTNTFNSRYFRSKINEKVKLNKDFSLIMMDLDDFKNINDTYGHLAGDQALKVFAGTVSKEIRSTDIFARYGGDEFCIIVNDIKDVDGLILRLEKELSSMSIDFNNEKFNLGCSLGSYTYSGGKTNVEHIISEADKELYNRKIKRKKKIENL